MKYAPFISAVKKDAANRHVYLLVGEEPWYIRHAEQLLIDLLVPNAAARADAVQRLNGSVPVSDLIARIDTVPMLSENLVLIVDNAAWFNAAASTAKATKPKTPAKSRKKAKAQSNPELLQATLAEMPPTTYVIFTSDKKPDKRLKLYKAVESVGLVLEAERERPWTINAWLAQKLRGLGREFTRDARQCFDGIVSMMGDIDLGFLDGELDKLALYTDARQITKADIEAALASLPEVSSFAMIDAINAKDAKRALTILERQIADGMYLPLILAGLVRNVRQLWQAKELTASGVYGRALGAPLGMNPFIAERLAMSAERFDVPTLRQVFLQLADADYLLKTGQAGPAALEAAVIALCSAGR